MGDKQDVWLHANLLVGVYEKVVCIAVSIGEEKDNPSKDYLQQGQLVRPLHGCENISQMTRPMPCPDWGETVICRL